LKVPGLVTLPLSLQCEKLLSKLAFRFNVFVPLHRAGASHLNGKEGTVLGIVPNKGSMAIVRLEDSGNEVGVSLCRLRNVFVFVVLRATRIID
jgi:hypothetical protein